MENPYNYKKFNEGAVGAEIPKHIKSRLHNLRPSTHPHPETGKVKVFNEVKKSPRLPDNFASIIDSEIKMKTPDGPIKVNLEGVSLEVRDAYEKAIRAATQGVAPFIRENSQGTVMSGNKLEDGLPAKNKAKISAIDIPKKTEKTTPEKTTPEIVFSNIPKNESPYGEEPGDEDMFGIVIEQQ